MKQEKIVKTNALRTLDQKKVPYNVYTYEHTDEATSGDEVARLINKDPNTVYKTLVTRSSQNKNNYYVFVIPVLENLDLKKAAKSINEKSIEMVHVKELLQLTGYVRGGCSPIGMKKQFTTTFNSSIESLDKIIFSAGKIGLQVEVSPIDLKKVINYKISEIIE